MQHSLSTVVLGRQWTRMVRDAIGEDMPALRNALEIIIAYRMI